MIKATFTRDEHGDIVKFLITGHADHGDYGKDIVCAGVSAVSIGAINGIEALAGFTPQVDADEVNGGHMLVEATGATTGEQNHIAQILLENLVLSVQSIADQYPDYVHVTTQQA